MKCRKCDNQEDFMVEGKELRLVSTKHPSELRSYFVVTSAVCVQGSCGSTDVELDPLHPSVKPYATAFGLDRMN